LREAEAGSLVEIHTSQGMQKVRAVWQSPYFAVTYSQGRGPDHPDGPLFGLTHLPSGKSAGQAFLTADAARVAAQYLASLPASWESQTPDTSRLPANLGSVLGCQNTSRLLCPNSELVLQVASQLLPHYTMVLVIGNTTDYAGAGGVVSTVSLAPSARDIAVHELGHSFAGLADEYVDEYINYAYVEGAYPNITTFSAREQVPWRVWIDPQTPVPTSLPPPETPDAVGLFYGGYYRAAGYFRPTLDSFMRNLGRNFGAVNGEAWARNVYAQGGAWSASAPDTKTPLLRTAQPAEGWLFKATPLMGRKIAETRWYVGDTELTDQRGATQLPLFSAIPVVVRVDLVDLTGRVRLNQGVVASLSWSIQ
jgi:hypothetical protein